LSGVTFLSAVGVFWFYDTSRLSALETGFIRYRQKVVQKIGLSLESILLEGREKTSRQEVLQALGGQRGDPIFKLNLEEAYQNLKKLRWVSSVMIERQLPSTLYIHLVEKQPIAFWQKNQRLYLVDKQGRIIEEAHPQEFPNFIIATGENAYQALPRLLQVLEKTPLLYQQVTGAVYMGQRRWDIILKNGLRVKLPEEHVEESCHLLVKLSREKCLNNPDVKSIDLRHSDRIYFYIKDGLLERNEKIQKKPI
jgi:cell division protein FtsQ